MDENINTTIPGVIEPANPPVEETLSGPRYVQKSIRFTDAQWSRVTAFADIALSRNLIHDQSFIGIVLLAVELAINHLNQGFPPPAAETPVNFMPFAEIVRVNLGLNDAQWNRLTKLAEYAHNQGLAPDTSVNTFLKFALLIAAEDMLKKFWLNDEGFQ